MLFIVIFLFMVREQQECRPVVELGKTKKTFHPKRLIGAERAALRRNCGIT